MPAAPARYAKPPGRHAFPDQRPGVVQRRAIIAGETVALAEDFGGGEDIRRDGTEEAPGSLEFVDPDRRASNSCVTWIVSVLSIPGTMPDFTGLSIGKVTRLNRK